MSLRNTLGACLVGLAAIAGSADAGNDRPQWSAQPDTTELLQIESFRSEPISIYFKRVEWGMGGHTIEWVVAKTVERSEDKRLLLIYPNPKYFFPGNAYVTYVPVKSGHLSLDVFTMLHMGKHWHAQSMTKLSGDYFNETFNQIECDGIIVPYEVNQNSVRYVEAP